jgi:hypothetical protein
MCLEQRPHVTPPARPPPRSLQRKTARARRLGKKKTKAVLSHTTRRASRRPYMHAIAPHQRRAALRPLFFFKTARAATTTYDLDRLAAEGITAPCRRSRRRGEDPRRACSYQGCPARCSRHGTQGPRARPAPSPVILREQRPRAVAELRTLHRSYVFAT